MTTPLHLPYFRKPEELPAPLPTTSEILASTDVLKGVEAWATRKVVGIGKHFVAKYSPSNDRTEADNMMFLERNGFQGIAPRLYAAWQENDGALFLVMERLPGETLESLWPGLQESEKGLILAKTREIIAKIRTVPHSSFFGTVDKGRMPHHLFYWPNYPANISGPFTSERALIQGLVAKSRLNAQENKRHSYLADFFEEQLIRGLAVDDRTPVFTHSDLQRKNILVEVVEGVHGERGFGVSLVDWESAGWYPVYWEYFAAFIAFKWNDDWCSRMVGIIDAWPAEAVMMKMIHQDLWL
ncbi:hypothetical protein G7Y89_g4551 [Cudoniella acicularis]|uniref:Aminoglycoside phosphotransferase domain-containing protein n=1 Tax=Cudoniella acicularis TaxID=354080 RepID=A0A8H4W7C3_9HELO|nr:hypothetical protein G7Y89_g4551 [Cudoniella acicularis]